MLRALLLILFQLEFQPLPFFFVFLAEVETFLKELKKVVKAYLSKNKHCVRLKTVCSLTSLCSNS
jgi:hypothetical protein